MYSSAPMPDLASRARTVVPIICAGLALMMPIQAPAHDTEREEARMAECIRQAADGRP